MKKLVGIILVSVLIFTAVLASIGCDSVSGNPNTTVPTPSATQVPNSSLIQNFVNNSSTFKFDGIAESLKIIKVVATPNGDGEFTIDYQTRQPGHGDRTGQFLAQVITNHTAIIRVQSGQIVSAVCDERWDLLKDKEVLNTVKVALGQEFTLQVGQKAEITAEDLDIKFEGVTNDSRAPSDAQAIWAGEAKIQAQIIYKGASSTKILTEKGLTDGYTQDTFNQYQISFKLQPYPKAGYQPAAGEYQLLMKITVPNK